MHSISVRITAPSLAGLTVLLAACGGGGDGDARSVLAVAFRLDDGTPVMAAYLGDPEEDPFLLPTGRYYVEALDEDDLVVSLGSVEVEGGEPISIPRDLQNAGGTPDPEAAEPLLTIANFLIDTELAEYAFLEIVTSGFELSPYDAGIEILPEDVVALFEAYGGILDQKDALLAAIGKVEDHAEVSAPVRRVSPRWLPASQIFGDLREVLTARLLKLQDDDPYGIAEILKRGTDIAKREEEARIALLEESFWIVQWNESTTSVSGKAPGLLMPKYPDLVTRHAEWEDYATELVGTIEDEASAQRAQARLNNRIADDYTKYMTKAGVSPRPADEVIINYFVKEVFTGALGPAAALAGVSATPTGADESPAPTPYPDWIDPHVQDAGDQWRAMGFDESAVTVAENNLRACLLATVEMGADEESARALCPDEGFEPSAPTPEPGQTSAPEPSGAPTSAPTLTPEPTPTPLPVTATGTFNFPDPGNATVTENTMTLRWNPAGGPIIFGEGRWRMQVPHYCGTEWESWSGQYSGTFDPVSNEFSGTYAGQLAQLHYHRDPEGQCVQDPGGSNPTGSWSATLSGSTVTGDAGPSGFTLTVSGAGSGTWESGPAVTLRTLFLLDSYARAALPSPSRMPLLRPR